MRSHVLAVAGLTVLAIAAPSTAAAHLPGVLTQHARHPFAVRPASIDYTGDGTGLIGGSDGTSVRHLGHLRWPTYTNRQGTGRGLVWLNDCDPNCADGDFSAFPVTLHVFAPKNSHFTRLTLQFTYQGKRVTDRRGIRYLPGSSGYQSHWV
jgi:hypothetical protein